MAARTKRGKVRGNGEGALYFSQARNRWIGVATITDPAAKDGRRRIKVTGPDRATTKDKLDQTGVPHEQIAEILGHAGTRTTEDVYIHQQEIIDMNTAVFDAYGNQDTSKETLNDGSEAV